MAKSGKEVIMNKVHYYVSGLLNEQLKAQVKHVLGDIEGVSMISVDLLKQYQRGRL